MLQSPSPEMTAIACEEEKDRGAAHVAGDKAYPRKVDIARAIFDTIRDQIWVRNPAARDWAELASDNQEFEPAYSVQRHAWRTQKRSGHVYTTTFRIKVLKLSRPQSRWNLRPYRHSGRVILKI